MGTVTAEKPNKLPLPPTEQNRKKTSSIDSSPNLITHVQHLAWNLVHVEYATDASLLSLGLL